MSVSLSARSVVKRYGGVVALSDANLDVQSGEVLALIGANGSGKSTLGKLINGVAALDGGQLLLDNHPAHISSPLAARNMGISTVFQELSLIPQMTIAENIWLTREPLRSGMLDRKQIKERTQALLSLFSDVVHSKMDADTQVLSLSPDEKQIIEILKAISPDPWLIILDEATASLDHRQVNRLFELVREWKRSGKAIIFISHRMEEILNIADRYSVLRNGITVGQGLMKEVTARSLVDMMVGKSSAQNIVQRERSASVSQPGERKVMLKVDDLHTDLLKGISFEVHAGELLGIGGLKGQGQRDLLLALFGDIPYKGTIHLAGEQVHFRHPSQAMKKGVALVPGERAKEGLLFIRSILENLLLPSWREYGFPIRMGKAVRNAARVSNDLSLKMAGLDEPVSSLSGGNAQKVVIGKWLLRNPHLLLLDDPTKGVDVNTKTEFYRLLIELCEQDLAVILYSSDDEELIGLCDRVQVMHDGVSRTELKGASLTKANLVAASLGASDESMRPTGENTQ